MSAKPRLLASVTQLILLGPALISRRASTRLSPRDRAALATVFFAKSILNLSTTRQLIDRLRADARLRRHCGWNHVRPPLSLRLPCLCRRVSSHRVDRVRGCDKGRAGDGTG